jgi:DNA-binding response OmpR family regulator
VIVTRILVLEDNESERRMMRLALERSGHVVVEAPDAQTATAICKDEPAIDLLICDIALPDVNGKDFIRSFRGSKPGVPVIAATGESVAHIEEPIAVAWYGASRVVGKPFTASELTTAVAELLDAGRQARASHC